MKSDWAVAFLATDGCIRKLSGFLDGHRAPCRDPFACLRVSPPAPHFAFINFVGQLGLRRHRQARVSAQGGSVLLQLSIPHFGPHGSIPESLIEVPVNGPLYP